MNKIIPSTKLKVVTVHKLWDTVCMRKYFWHRVMNLEPRYINMNFWYGGVLGAGWEAALQGRKPAQIKLAMRRESKKRTSRHALSSEDHMEIDFQLQLIWLFIEGAMKQRRQDFDFSKMKVTTPQQKVSYQLEDSDVIFCGTNDGLGVYRNGECMFENKTARYVNNDYISKIAFDMQIHSYANALPNCPKKCCYCIFTKTAKKIKRSRGQTSEGFLEEIASDIKTDPRKFFILHEHIFSQRMLSQVAADVEAGAWRLSQMYDGLSGKELLNPLNWDRQSQQCLHFGACEYLMLCKNVQSWKVCERMYQMRELMYDQEEEELA